MTKKIEAFIREEKLEDVKQALHDIGIVGMNVLEVHGHGRQGGITLAWRTGTYKVDMLPRFQLNIVLSDDNLDKTVEIIRNAAYTGRRATASSSSTRRRCDPNPHQRTGSRRAQLPGRYRHPQVTRPRRKSLAARAT